MKGILGCCYQCDVPPETIQNLRILCMSLKSRPTTQNRLYLHMVYLLTQCATTTRKIFLFFLGGPARSPHNCFFLGGPARTPHSGRKLPSCQENYLWIT